VAGGHGAGLAAGFTFVASILAGLLAGTWLDGHFNHSSTPWWTMVMTLAGAGVGFTNMFKLLSRGSGRKP
jgi:F0F1-type ATP synthase assembly protein I